MRVNFDFKLGKHLKMKRVELDLQLKDVAEALNVSSSALNHLENRTSEEVLIIRYLQFIHDKGVDINQFFKKEE